MKTTDKYHIVVEGLENGVHSYAFDLDDTFLSALSQSDVHHIMVHFDIQIIKSGQLISVNFSLKGNLSVPCDRCLDLIQIPVAYHEELPARYAVSEDETSSDEVLIIPGENEIRLSPWFAEFIEVSIPMQHIHPNGKGGKSGCNPDMLLKLKQHGHAENHQIDPRWNKLKDLTN